jgi:WXG100 family type VII secretion target
MTSGVVWSIDAMQQGLSDINQVSGGLNGTFADLNSELTKFTEFWVGAGNESYQAVQKQWNDAMEGMLQVLQSISKALATSIDIHSATEQSIQGGWQ